MTWLELFILSCGFVWIVAVSVHRSVGIVCGDYANDTRAFYKSENTDHYIIVGVIGAPLVSVGNEHVYKYNYYTIITRHGQS